MSGKWSVVAVFAVALSGVAHAQLHEWTVGEERELSPGYYTKVLAKQDGWVTFRIESRDNVRCFTAKPQDGHDLPEPYEDMVVVYGEPHIELGGGYGGFSERAWWSIEGRHQGEAEYRVEGERFMRPDEILNEDFSIDGQRIEFKYEGWEYPAVLVGYYTAQGAFDLTGMAAARDRHEELCREAYGDG